MRLKNYIKSWIYNSLPESLIMLGLAIFLLVNCIILTKTNTTLSIVFCFLSIALQIAIYANYRRNTKSSKENQYLSYMTSIFSKKYIWINQKVNRNRRQDVCPQKEFVKEMMNLLHDVPSGTICLCYTHEQIKNFIEKKFPCANITYVRQRRLGKLKKQIQTDKCKQCKAKKCTIEQNNITNFYAIRFVK